MDSWSVVASLGDHHVRFIDNTVAGCLAWAARMRFLDWTVSEPVRWPGFGEPWDGFGGYEVRDDSERSAA